MNSVFLNIFNYKNTIVSFSDMFACSYIFPCAQLSVILFSKDFSIHYFLTSWIFLHFLQQTEHNCLRKKIILLVMFLFIMWKSIQAQSGDFLVQDFNGVLGWNVAAVFFKFIIKNIGDFIQLLIQPFDFFIVGQHFH